MQIEGLSVVESAARAGSGDGLSPALAGTGSATGGFLGVHLLCPLVDPRHVLAGHASVPPVATALGA